jgi:hypothetical protein
MKNFRTDFTKFYEKIKNHQPFAISRNNDGEMIILFNEFIDLRQKLNGEFIYDPKQEQHGFFRKKLLESAQYKADNYYVGIACRCCVGNEKHEKLKTLTGQDEEHLTWGNIFVNSNYPQYVEKIIPEFKKYNVVMVVNNKAITYNLPFLNNIVKTFTIGTNAWMSNYSLVDEMKRYIEENKIENHMFLFAAGPFSNILIMECFKSSPNNTYLDIGSTLDSMMSLGATRGYLRGADTLNKICVW